MQNGVASFWRKSKGSVQWLIIFIGIGQPCFLPTPPVELLSFLFFSFEKCSSN
jgi:hypothetical protein